MVISSEEREKILSELEEEFKIGDIEPDEITVKMMAESTGLSTKRANDILNQKVIDGLFTSRYVKDSYGNKRQKAYRKVKNDRRNLSRN